MDAIVATLFEGCIKAGIPASQRFADVQAFRDHLHRTCSRAGEPLSRRQLELMQDAIIQAAHHDVTAVVRDLEGIRGI